MARRNNAKRVTNSDSGKEKNVVPNSRNSKYRGKGKEASKEGLHCKSDMDKATASNDITWYTKSVNLLGAAASLPYGYPVGNPINFDNGNFSIYTTPGYRYDAVPGIMTLALLTGPGDSKDVNSPVNVAARDIYSYVRYANSGHANYDPVDLMMYILAWDEVSMWLANARRVYGAMYTYNSQNKYAPKYLVEALGFDYDDLNANLAQFRYAINAATNRFNSLNMPNNMSYLTRHVWLYSNIYSDGTSPKSQLYAYVPAACRVYNETTSSQGGYLDTIPLAYYGGTEQLTFTKWVEITNQLLNALIGSEDIGIMSGDILKAFGSDKTIVTPTISDVYSVAPVYNEEVLSQFQNATIVNGAMPKAEEAKVWNITQDPSIDQGIILYDPTFKIPFPGKANGVASNANRVLSLNINDPKPGDTMVASRLMTITECVGEVTTPSNPTVIHCLTAGTEIPVTGYISAGYRFTEGGKPKYGIAKYTVGMNFSYNATNSPTSQSEFRTLIGVLAKMSAFKFHPMDTVMSYTYTEGSSQPASRGALQYFFEVDNYTIIDVETLRQMHETAVLSEFDVPINFKTSGAI